jgi:Rap1a immunity proteins
MKCLRPAVIMMVVSLGTPCFADIKDGDSLLKYCTATIGAYVTYCFGYIDSVVDDLLANKIVDGFSACITIELDDSRRKDIVVQFLNDNPALRYLGAPELVARALSEAFPCQ